MVALPTVFQFPDFLRWILTGTPETQAVNVSPTLTDPRATRCFFRLSVTVLEWGVLTVKLVELVAVPPGVVTLIGPVVAVDGTVAVICVAEFTTNVAVTLLKVTPVVVKLAPLTVPLKFVPVILTDVPGAPKVGVNDVIVGAGTGVTVKLVALVASPAAVYTWIGPVVAPAGTTAVALVGLVFVGVTRLEVLKRTPVGAVPKVPLIVTVEPTMPLEGEKVGTPGQAASGPVENENAAELSAPLLATTFAETLSPTLAGIVTSIWVLESTRSPVPAVAPKSTSVRGLVWKFVPIMVTSQPSEAVLGVTEVMVGATA